MHRRLLVLGVLIAAMLATAAPAGSSDNQGAVIRHLRAQVKLVKQQRDTARSQLGGARANLKQAKSDLIDAKAAETTAGTSLVTAQGQVTTLTAQLAAAQAAIVQGGLAFISSMTPDQAWGAVPTLAARMPSTGPLCGYSQSHFTGSSFESYELDKFAPC